MPRPALRSVATLNARHLHGLAAGLVLALTGLAMGQQAAPAAPLDLSGLSIRRNGYQGAVNFVNSKDGTAIKVDVPKGRSRLASLAFLDTYGQLFGITDAAAQLALRTVEPDPLGWSHTTYQQVHKGIKVFTGTIKVHQNVAGGVVGANGHFRPIKPSLGVVPTIDAPGAEAIALKTVIEAPRAIVEHSELMIVDPGWYGDAPTGEKLAYYVVITDVEISVREAMFIDAHTGEIMDRWSLIEQLLNREIHDAAGTNALPGPLSRSEGQAAVGIADVDAAYDYAGDFYRYLQRAFGRDSIDNAGLTIVITPNSTAAQCPNAFWNGFQAAFCTGVVTDDVVAHELAHGLTGYTAGLIYQNQPGQLNESFSDVFGELVDMFNGNVSAIGAPSGTPWPLPPAVGPGIDTPNNARSVCSPRPAHPDGVRWLVGEDSAAFGGAIRDMFDPTCRNHPDRANSTFQTCNPNDSGGVHSGSGVPNHAFMLTTDGGTFNGRTITGIGLIKSGAVWYRALTVYLTPASDFKDAYDALTSAATDLIGTSPNDPRTGTPGATFTAFDALQVTEALLATEMNTDGLCGQTSNVLNETLPPECANATVLFSDDFESPTLNWTVTNSAPPTPYNWVRAAALPFGRTGHAAYCENRAVGDCNLIDESATHTMTSPSFAVPAGSTRPFLAFTHQLGSEGQFDGGTLEISINGGAFTPVPRTAIEFNPFNGQLSSSAVGNTNPLAGRDAWTGTGGKWGRTVVDLSSLGIVGANVQVRLIFGKDGCAGSTGWYVDDLVVYNCPDCDIDGTADLRQYRYRASSPTLTTIGNGENRTFTLAATPAASGNITLELTAKGDFSSATEYVEVSLNGIAAGRIFEVGGVDCTSGSVTALRGSLSVPAATWNSARALGAAGNTVDILLTGSADMNPNICNGTYVGANVRYDVAGPTDTNSNLVPDSCEVQCVSIIGQPAAAINACLGGSLNLLIAATGTAPVTYQWTRNNINIAGATTPIFNVSPVIAGTAGTYRCVVTNTCGPLTSNPSVVTVASLPTITQEPQSVTTCFNFPISLTVTANATGTITYQWRKNTVNIPGATTSSYFITVFQAADVGSYDCLVSTACGSTTSQSASLVGTSTLTVSPVGQTLLTPCQGSPLTMTVTLNNSTAATVQWRKNNVDIPGATSLSYTIPSTSVADTASYLCRGTNPCGSTNSSSFTVNVQQPIVINTQPVAFSGCLNGGASFSIGATGGTPTYQWRRNGSPLVNSGSISGVLTPALNLFVLTPAIHAGTYDCVVTNSCGPVTSNPAALTIDTTPTVTASPTTTTSCEGSPLTLTASAVGGSPAYQWRKGGIPISGATSQTLNFANLALGDAGSYDVLVTNGCGTSPASNAVSVTVRPPITGFSTQPTSQALCRGASLTLTAIADPAAAQATYQWRKNTVNIPGATASTLLVTNSATAATAGTYDCVATNICGNNTSSAATITYCAADFNCSGAISVQDIFDFLAAYFANDTAADFNNSSTISVQDIFDFLSAYFGGC